MRTRPYVARQGDYMARVAVAIRASSDEIWEHPKNHALREQSRASNMLHPGDVLHVPDRSSAAQPISLGAANSFRAEIPRVSVSLQLDGEVFGGRRFEVRDPSGPLHDTADGDGTIRFEVPTTVSAVDVVFPEIHRAFDVRVGHVDPPTERSGVAGRLRQLGFLEPDVPGSRHNIAAALGRFQDAHDLEPTGECDAETLGLLIGRFGM